LVISTIKDGKWYKIKISKKIENSMINISAIFVYFFNRELIKFFLYISPNSLFCQEFYLAICKIIYFTI